MGTKTVAVLKRSVAAVVVATILALGSVQAAWAAMPWPWILEGTRYKSASSCASRGFTLVLTGQYEDWHCAQDEFSEPDRWSLWVRPPYARKG